MGTVMQCKDCKRCFDNEAHFFLDITGRCDECQEYNFEIDDRDHAIFSEANGKCCYCHYPVQYWCTRIVDGTRRLFCNKCAELNTMFYYEKPVSHMTKDLLREITKDKYEAYNDLFTNEKELLRAKANAIKKYEYE